MTAPLRRSFPTWYNGRQFRSKLEADWARFFDAIGLTEWEYEPGGQYFGDLFYAPDFWLPRSRQWFEVKGIFQPADLRKFAALLTEAAPRPHTSDALCVPDLPIVCGVPGGKFWGFRRPSDRRNLLALDRLLLDHNPRTALARCARCGGWWFLAQTEGYRCQCCGAWDGHQHLAEFLTSPIDPWPVRTGPLPLDS